MQLKNLNVVAIGGGHGLGRVLSTLSFLGTQLTGIVSTTDNGGSTGDLDCRQKCEDHDGCKFYTIWINSN